MRPTKVAFLIERNMPSLYIPPLLDPIYQAFGTSVIIKGQKSDAEDDELIVSPFSSFTV
jgi:hypothetical protein